MSTLWRYTRQSLDESLGLLAGDLEKLQAARPVEIAEIVQQFETATEAARNLRSLISGEMPDASWQSREELERLLDTIQENHELKTLRSRLTELASELERGSFVHRRAARVDQLNQFRDDAIKELRSLAEMKELPPALPGPEAGKWVEWACGLKEPEDTEPLQILRNSFLYLDDFVAHLEPDTWVVKSEMA